MKVLISGAGIAGNSLAFWLSNTKSPSLNGSLLLGLVVSR